MTTDEASAVELAVLSDAYADHQLRVDGFTTIGRPVIDQVTAAGLRQWFQRRFPGRRSGWHNAFNDPDVDYRRAAQQVLRAALADALADLLPRYDPFLFTFLVKWHGEDATDNFLYCHRDWMYVDETGGDRCYVVFIALEDIDAENGCVAILPHGNDMDRMLRGSGLQAKWLEQDEVLKPHLVPVALEVGHAAIWDGAIVHASLPNRRPEPRVAVGVWMRPRGAQLVHYRRVSPELAELHIVDPEFFAAYTPETLHGFLDAREPVALVPTNERHQSEQDLRRALASIGAGANAPD